METGQEQQNQGQENQSTTDVNFDALSAPEGQYDPFVHGNGNGGDGQDPIPGGSGLPDNLPNLDDDLNKSNGQGNPNPEPNGENQQQPDPSSQANQQQQDAGGEQSPTSPDNGTDSPYWMKPFEQLKQAYPDWNIPEGITEENYLQVYNQVTQPQIHPELQRIQEALNSGAQWEDVVKGMQGQQSLTAISDRDLMAANFKQEYPDWDDAKINGVLDKMDNNGMLEIEAGKLRKEIDAYNQNFASHQAAKNQEILQQQEKEIAELRTKQINESLDIINKTEDIYGLPISQAEKQEFGQFFSKMVTPDPQTGVAPMMELLQDNSNLVKVAMMLWKGDDKVRAALTDAKEHGKNAVLDQLDSRPQTPRNGGGQQDPNQVDLDLLAAPARITS